MSKHKLFNTDENDSFVDSSLRVKLSPVRSRSIHPALVSCPEKGKTSCRKSAVASSCEKTVKKSKTVSNDNAEDNISDPLEVTDFFSNYNQKLPYTKQEDELIVKYVLKGQNIFKVTSILLWKHLEAKKENPKRTYQSLKNRFLRNIKPYIFSTFRHLIKDEETAEKILSKFPELKKHTGKKEVLSRLNLPEGTSSKGPEDGVSNPNTKKSHVNAEIEENRLRKSDSVDEANRADHGEPIQPEELIRPEPKLLGSDFFKPVIYRREVNANNEDLIVCVDLKSKKCVETFSSSPLGIYEKFKKIKDGNILVLCPTCGRYNRPKEDMSMQFSEDTDVFVPNSVETSKSEPKSLKKLRLTLKLKSTRTSRSRRLSSKSESSARTPCSPNLLRNISEADKIIKRASDLAKDNSEIAEVLEISDPRISTNNTDKAVFRKQATQSSNSCNKGGNKSNNNKKSNAEAVREGNEVSNSKSNTNSNSVAAKRTRDSDTDIDSICEEAMASFRKLIDLEEEKMLVRKCLNKNFKSIGLEAVSQMNLDSYFLESSSDMESTPPLTIDFDANPGSCEKEQSIGSANGSQNLRQMLNENCKTILLRSGTRNLRGNVAK